MVGVCGFVEEYVANLLEVFFSAGFAIAPRPRRTSYTKLGIKHHVTRTSRAHDGVPFGLMAIINWSWTYDWVPWLTIEFSTA